MKTVHSITYKKIARNKAVGLAYKDTGEIVIDERLKGFSRLQAILHEIFHCQHPKTSEIKIEGLSTEVAQLLWDEGYRKTD